MLHPPQGPQFQAPELLQQILQREALIGFDLAQHGRGHIPPDLVVERGRRSLKAS
jgi:hypothetical protein